MRREWLRSLPAATLLALLAHSPSSAQEPPPTDVYLIPIELAEGEPRLGEPKNVTDRAGYDNQPRFLPDGSGVLYTSIREGQADTYLYDLETGEHRPVTATPESEYSPTPIPGERAISVVRVEADDRQRLWRFPLGEGEPELILPDVEPVGYHAWADAESLALFVLGEPPTLERATPGPGAATRVASDIGRGLGAVPGERAVVFVHNMPEGARLERYDFASGELSDLAAVRDGSQDFALAPTGEIWMAESTTLYRLDRASGEGWRKVADLAPAGLGAITRLDIHPGGTWLAAVAARPADQSPSQSQK